MMPSLRTATSLLALACLASPTLALPQAVDGPWLSWRGPDQNGTSRETGLVDTIAVDGDALLWTQPIAGRGTPVVAEDRVYSLGYEGEGKDLQEVLSCLDLATGETLWEARFSDFLSDVIYDRYSIGSPTVDPETGNVFVLTTPGLLVASAPDGEELWRHALGSQFGRLTFPNGRTGAPLVHDDVVVVHVITAGWGPQAPARDRFIAFDKRNGDAVWTSTPGTGPRDSSFSFPVVTEQNGRDVLLAGTGCGNIVCFEAATGDPVWRFPFSNGGVNSSVVLFDDGLIAIHGKENLDSSVIGRMVSIPLGAEPEPGKEGPAVVPASAERWRQDLVAFSSSPVLVGDRVYQTVATGELVCVDAASGDVLWQHKLAPDQIHASPVAADGKLYVPMTNGKLFVVRPPAGAAPTEGGGDASSGSGVEVLSETQLEGSCLGAPAIANGRILVHTTEKLYCFGAPERAVAAPARPAPEAVEPGPPARLVVVPSDVLLRPGDTVAFRVRALDEHGHVVPAPAEASWNLNRLGGRVSADGVLSLPAEALPGTGAVSVSADGLTGSSRVRVVHGVPFALDFSDYELGPHPDEEGVSYADPPGEWIGGRKKWEIRELDGEKVLAKTLDNNLFQRTLTWIGHPDSSNYTVRMDILTDGNRRTMSSAGMVVQRYLVQLKGNHQEIEVSSNMERIKESVPFSWRPNTWYTLEARVDVAEDGSGVIRAKAWKRGDPEPDAWNIEVHHAHAHTHGAPGLFGFTPQNRFRVYVDNYVVTPND